MNCDQCRAALLAGEVTEAERRHLSTCAACRAESAHLEQAATTLRDPILWEEPGPGLREQTAERIQAAASPGRTAVGWPRWIAPAAAIVGGLVVAAGLWFAGGRDSPDWQVTIAGTDLAASATGQVEGWRDASGTRVELAIDGLGPAPSGHYYELWFSGDGAQVSAGTFTTAQDLEFHVGVSRRDLPNVWISLEPTDGDPTSSGNAVMVTKG